MQTFKSSEQLNELYGALSKAQAEIDNVVSDKKAYNFNYADLGQIIKAVKKPLAVNGLAVIQTPFSHVDESGIVRDGVSTRLCHSSGQWVESSMMSPAAMSGGKMSAIQGIGSNITYMRRYMLAAVLGVAQVDDENELINAHSQPQVDNATRNKLIANAEKFARQGAEAFARHWSGLSAQERNAIGVNEFNRIKSLFKQNSEVENE